MRGGGCIGHQLRNGHSPLEPPSHLPHDARPPQHTCNGRLPPQSLETLVGLLVDIDHRVGRRRQRPLARRVGTAGRAVPQVGRNPCEPRMRRLFKPAVRSPIRNIHLPIALSKPASPPPIEALTSSQSKLASDWHRWIAGSLRASVSQSLCRIRLAGTTWPREEPTHVPLNHLCFFNFRIDDLFLGSFSSICADDI